MDTYFTIGLVLALIFNIYVWIFRRTDMNGEMIFLLLPVTLFIFVIWPLCIFFVLFVLSVKGSSHMAGLIPD